VLQRRTGLRTVHEPNPINDLARTKTRWSPRAPQNVFADVKQKPSFFDAPDAPPVRRTARVLAFHLTGTQLA
jgi:hypothetical protein